MPTLEEYRGNFSISPQLPASWFNDQNIYDLEQELVFKKAASYVGHQLMVPQQGDFFVLDWMKQSKLLIQSNQGEYQLMSNICKHRQALILKGRGHAKRIICPLHRWVYDLKGNLEAAPYFENKPCAQLESQTLHHWQGLLFSGAHDQVLQDLQNCKFKNYFDFSKYQFSNMEITHYDFDWKTFIEVYLEDYHVVPFHPGLGHFVDCKNLEWQYGDRFSVQTVGVLNKLKRAGSPIYEQWHAEVLNAYGQSSPEYGAIWLTYYPSLTLEWYPNVLVVSNIIPTAPGKCMNVVEFYYPKAILEAFPNYAKAQQAAYMETAIEDQEICERMQQGREALSRDQKNECGPYLEHLEDGLEHFNYWLRSQLQIDS
jgi:choline monooxygenase